MLPVAWSQTSGRVACAVLAILALGAGLTVLVVSAPAPGSASPRAGVVPVTVLDGQGTPEGARPVVDVRVGSSQPVPVLLDTGSSGLHIFDTAVKTGPGSGVALTSKPANITYAGGHRFTGVVGTAVVTLGSYATKGPIPFAYVERAHCIATKPTCPAAGGMPGFERSGAFGILGIGTQSSGGGVVSPILGMPGSLGRKWSIHLVGTSGTLFLGAQPPRRRSATEIQMKEIGSSAGGKALWADSRLPVCVSVGMVNECVPGLFDSGTYTMQVSGPALDQAPVVPGTTHVVAGAPVSVTVNGAASPFWTFASGSIKSENLVTVRSDHGPFLNAGVQVFYDFTVTYDDVRGQIRLS